MKKIFILFLGFILSVVVVNAQTQWEWDTHGIGFETPEGFKVDKNSEDMFTASSEHISVTLIPWQDETVTDNDLSGALVELAVEMEYDEITEVEVLEYEDFVGYGVSGSKDGSNAVIAILLDTESSTNLIVVIGFDEGYEDVASKILSGIYPYDK